MSEGTTTNNPNDTFEARYTTLPPEARPLIDRAIDRLHRGMEPAAVQQAFNRELVQHMREHPPAT